MRIGQIVEGLKGLELEFIPGFKDGWYAAALEGGGTLTFMPSHPSPLVILGLHDGNGKELEAKTFAIDEDARVLKALNYMALLADGKPFTFQPENPEEEAVYLEMHYRGRVAMKTRPMLFTGGKTRDPARIDRLLEKLGDYWRSQPDMRLAQAVCNFAMLARPGADPYFVEDHDIETAMDELLARDSDSSSRP